MKTNLSRKQNNKFTFDHIIGDSEAIQSIIAEGKRVIRTSSSILLVGETGTGKELFAQSIHNESQRSGKPFISQNCAAIPDTLMEVYYLVRTEVHLQELSIKPVYLKKRTEELCY